MVAVEKEIGMTQRDSVYDLLVLLKLFFFQGISYNQYYCHLTTTAAVVNNA